MRIAVFHELPRGGARRAINAYSSELKKKHRVDLFLVDDKEIFDEKKYYSEVFYYKFTPKEWKGRNWKTRLYKDTIELFNIARLHKKIALDIDKKGYDFVLVSSSKYIQAPFIMRFLKSPFLFYTHDPSYRIIYDKLLQISNDLDLFRQLYEKLNRFVRKILDRQNISFAPYVLVPSRFISEEFVKIYNKKCKVIYYGIDTGFFKPSDESKQHDLFYIGSKDPIDGYDFLLEVIKLMKTKPKLRTLLTDKEWISDDIGLREIYRRTKIFVATARKEGLGASLMEAMACGVLVVAVDEGGHKEIIIDGRTGYLIDRAPNIFAKKLDTLLLNPSALKLFSKNARKVMIENWDWSKRTEDLEKEIITFLQK
ncbi:MAG: glycosyltransferase family 4 protein [Candidatus Levybacteria bacterium]|nr:glycosyltransferase family 4 protein [Candidatus Levybacteria bacterium]